MNGYTLSGRSLTAAPLYSGLNSVAATATIVAVPVYFYADAITVAIVFALLRKAVRTTAETVILCTAAATAAAAEDI